MKNNHQMTREQTQKQLQRNSETDVRPHYKQVGDNGSNKSPVFKPEMFTQTHQSWAKQLEAKQFRIHKRGNKYAEVVTRSFYDHQKKQPEFVPLNSDDRRRKQHV